MPSALAHVRQRLALTGRVGTEDHAAARQLEPTIQSSGDSARVNISGVRRNAAQGSDFRFGGSLSGAGRRGGKRLNFSAQALGVGRVKATCNGWSPNRGGHSVPFLTCRRSVPIAVLT